MSRVLFFRCCLPPQVSVSHFRFFSPALPSVVTFVSPFAPSRLAVSGLGRLGAGVSEACGPGGFGSRRARQGAGERGNDGEGEKAGAVGTGRGSGEAGGSRERTW